MNQRIRLIVSTTAMGLALMAGVGAHSSQRTTSLNSLPDAPTIIHQPEDQAIWLGSNVTFTVSSDHAAGFQWTRNGAVLRGQTNSTLALANVKVSDVGLYSCYVSKGAEAVATRSATLNVMSDSGGGPITVFGTPLPGSGGAGTDCPGPYAGYVNFIKPGAAWGWVPTSGASTHTATDPNRSDTHIVYAGRFLDSGCDATTVAVNPVISFKYRFTVYFPDNVPTNTYSIVLEGFNP